MKQTDKHWEGYGRTDPYYGVLTQPKFKKENLDSQSLQEFFSTGEDFIGNLFEQIRQQVAPSFNPELALDFGCGVGRLVIPMARRCKMVHGVDVSVSMIAEAKKNAALHHANNVEFFLSDDSLSKIGNKYDFINSYFVLQHIPLKRGMQLFEELLNRLAKDGVFSLQVPYYTHRTQVRGIVSKLRRYVPLINSAANVLEGKPLKYPHLEMNIYPLDLLFRVVQDHGVKCLSLNLESDPLFLSATLIGQKI